MAKLGPVTLEVHPTVTLESAVVCVYMLNLFLHDNDEYRLELRNDGGKVEWALTDGPVMRTGAPDLHAQKLRADIETMDEKTQAELSAHFRKLAGLEDE